MAKIISPAPGAGRGQARPAVSPALLAALAGRLTARDRWLLRMLLEHRVLTTTQITDLAYGGPRRAALRLSELYRLRAVDRFRPLAATGSSPYHWVLDQAGAEVLAAEDGVPLARLGYRRDRALDIAFSPRLAHTTGANGFFAALARAARRGGGELACWWSERRCAALWGDLARPDGYGLWRDPGGAGTDFFLEYDTGSEDLPRLAAKLTGYRELASRTQIATPVLFWLASGPHREQQFRALLAAAGPVPGVPVAHRHPRLGPGRRRPGRSGVAARLAARPPAAARAGSRRRARRPARRAAARRRHRAGLASARPAPAARRRVRRRQPGAQGGAVTGRRIAACALAAVLAAGCAACTSWQPQPAAAALACRQQPARDAGSSGYPGAGRDLAVQPGPAAGRRRPGRPVHRQLGLLVLAPVPGRLAGPAAPP